MKTFLHLFVVVFALSLGLPANAQEATDDVPAASVTPTLEDILRRQEGLKVDDSARSALTGEEVDPAAASESPLGTLGGASDSDLWRALRFDEGNITTQSRSPAAGVLVQDSGMQWLQFRQGPLIKYGGYLLLGTLALLAVFFLIRGRIRIDGPITGQKILRFTNWERFGHWMLAGSFIVLGITGLISLMGRKFLIPAFGHEAFSTVAIASKWVHNNISWAFMIALVMIFVMWVVHNLPDRTDINWILKGGGIFSKSHPPAKKFNAGQKLIFWSVIVFGVSISVSGLSLLFPFEISLFAPTFAKLNSLGVPGWFGMAPLPTDLAPHQEMQLSQLWHAVVSFGLMAIILAHIYIGSIGMEGAFDAMGDGEVEVAWAKEHHSIWADEVLSETAQGKESATPAE